MFAILERTSITEETEPQPVQRQTDREAIANLRVMLDLTPKGRKALAVPPEETIGLLWQRWKAKGLIDEFSRVENIKGQRSKNVLSAVVPRRRIVSKVLEESEQAEWIDIDDLFNTMRLGHLDPEVTRSEMARWKLYIEDPEYGSLGYDDYGKWPLIEGRYTLAVLFEYAAVLGLIDVEYVAPEDGRDDYLYQWGGDG